MPKHPPDTMQYKPSIAKEATFYEYPTRHWLRILAAYQIRPWPQENRISTFPLGPRGGCDARHRVSLDSKAHVLYSTYNTYLEYVRDTIIRIVYQTASRAVQPAGNSTCSSRLVTCHERARLNFPPVWSLRLRTPCSLKRPLEDCLVWLQLRQLATIRIEETGNLSPRNKHIFICFIIHQSCICPSFDSQGCRICLCSCFYRGIIYQANRQPAISSPLPPHGTKDGGCRMGAGVKAQITPAMPCGIT